MKSVINGKRYDTATANLIGEASSNLPRNDYGWWQEALYQTPRSGAWFLAGEGHARSHYATNLGGGTWGPGSKITPLTQAEALAWAERNMSAGEIEKNFGGNIEDA